VRPPDKAIQPEHDRHNENVVGMAIPELCSSNRQIISLVDQEQLFSLGRAEGEEGKKRLLLSDQMHASRMRIARRMDDGGDGDGHLHHQSSAKYIDWALK
jgi:hypothetical protein